MKQSLFLKILLYNLSLLPLYVIYFIKLMSAKDYKCYIFLFLIAISIISLFIIKNNFLNRGDIIDNIVSIRKKDYEYFTFLSVFILPLFGVAVRELKDLVILFLILYFMGFIYIKGDFLYLNPIYLVFGWYLYEGIYKGKRIIFLSDDKNVESNIKEGYILKQISEGFYFTKRLNDGFK